jgi:hypothetical protein
VSSDHRLSRGFCWPARVEPGEVETDDREVVFAVAVVADELEERIRKGMWWGLLMVRVRPLVVLLLPLALLLALPPLLLMLVLGRRVVMVLFMLMLRDRLDLRGW